MAKRALCIGINDYPGTGSDLSGCVNDANDWAAAFAKRGFSVATLFDRKATGAGIRTAIRRLLDASKRRDSMIIQFSGHGSFVPDEDGDEPDGTDECICPYDIADRDPITDDELFDLYSSKSPGSRLVMISDSCHSGTVARFAPITTPPTLPGPTAPRRIVRFLPPAVFLTKREAGKLGLSRALHRSSPPRPLRRAADVRLPGHRIQLRRLVPGSAERRLHLRGPARFESTAGPVDLPRLV